MTVAEIKPRDHVFAVVSVDHEDFAWLPIKPTDTANKLFVVEGMVHHVEESDSSAVAILDGDCFGVFGANVSDVFTSLDAAKIAIAQKNKEKAIELMNQTSTIAGMLQFLIDFEMISIPNDELAREVFFARMEDAGLSNLIPLYSERSDRA